jgi:hypothetical protein
MYFAHIPVDGPWPYVFVAVSERRPWWTTLCMRLERRLYPHWQYGGLIPGTVWFIEWRRLWIWWVTP